MNEMNQSQDDEIDLFQLFQTLWDGKWKIISTTFIAVVIVYLWCVLTPNYFEVSTPIKSGKQSVFLKYASLNQLLKSNQFSFSIGENSMFEKFIVEFNDYDEMIDAVSTSELVQKSIKDLDDENKQKALIAFAKSFLLKTPSNKEENWILSFEWHDTFEGKRLLNNAINKTLSNIRNDTVSNINTLITVIDNRNSNQIELLRQRLKVIESKQIALNAKRIQFLKEHSAIAKELGIARNTLDNNLLFQSQNGRVSLESEKNKVSISSNSDDVPYYLRGYKPIDKEIALINSRSKKQNLLRSLEYIETKAKITSLETDISSFQLRNATKMLLTENPNNLIEFDLALTDIISKKKKKSSLYVLLSILLGGMVGVLYVLISNGIRNRKKQLAEV